MATADAPAHGRSGVDSAIPDLTAISPTISQDGDRGDSFSDEALRTLLTETENNRNSLCVVLAGYRDGMAHLMRADPGTLAAESNRGRVY